MRVQPRSAVSRRLLESQLQEAANHHHFKSTDTRLGQVLCHAITVNSPSNPSARYSYCSLVTQEDTETQRDYAHGHPAGLRLPSSCGAQTVSLQDRPKEKELLVTRKRVGVPSFGRREEPGTGSLLPSLSHVCFTLGPVQVQP